MATLPLTVGPLRAMGASLITLVTPEFIIGFTQSRTSNEKLAVQIQEAAKHTYCQLCRAVACAYIEEHPVATVLSACGDGRGRTRSLGPLFEWLRVFYNLHHAEAPRTLSQVEDYFSPQPVSEPEEDFCLRCDATQKWSVGAGFVYEVRALHDLELHLHRAEQPPSQRDYTINGVGDVIVPPAPSPKSGDMLAIGHYRGGYNNFPLGVSAFLVRAQSGHGVAHSTHLQLDLPCFTLMPTTEVESQFRLLLTHYLRLSQHSKVGYKPEVCYTPHFSLVPQQSCSVAAFEALFVAKEAPMIWEQCSSFVIRGAADQREVRDAEIGEDDGSGVPAWPVDLNGVDDRDVRFMYIHVRACYPSLVGMERLIFNDMLTTIALDKPTLYELSFNHARLRAWFHAVKAVISRVPQKSREFWSWAHVEGSLESLLIQDDGESNIEEQETFPV